jgi:hypothetical protein
LVLGCDDERIVSEAAEWLAAIPVGLPASMTRLRRHLHVLNQGGQGAWTMSSRDRGVGWMRGWPNLVGA